MPHDEHIERDENGDEAVAEQLRRFGQTVRAEDDVEPLFAPARDVSWLDRADGGQRLGLPRRVIGLFALAAMVTVIAGVSWWLVLPEQVPDITAMRLSRTSGVLRGDEAPVFHSGERIWLHFDAAAAGAGLVALLDELGELSAVTPTPIDLARGANVVGPFVLDDQVGTASLIVIAMDKAPPGWLDSALARARGRIADGAEHEASLAEVVASLEGEGGVTVRTITYRHLP